MLQKLPYIFQNGTFILVNYSRNKEGIKIIQNHMNAIWRIETVL